MPKPFVSVLIDTYNHERFIEQAIVSVLEQDFPASDREIIVVDDGSADGTPEIVRKFEPHVRLLCKENGGQASAFNAGIPECKGEVVAFLDGDDWWNQTKLSAVSRELHADCDVGAVGHGLYEVNDKGEQPILNIPNRTYRNLLRSQADAVELTELLSFLGTSRLTVRKATLNKILPVPDTLLADLFLAAMATAVSGALVVEQPLTNYRLHAANIYQFSEFDKSRMRRKLEGLRSFGRELPPRLRQWGVPQVVVDVLMYPSWLDAERLRLALGDGWPWDTLKIEREAHRHAYRGATFGYHVFHAAVLAAAAVLPPAAFYRLRSWYAAKGLARARKAVGSAEPVPSLVVRKAPGA